MSNALPKAVSLLTVLALVFIAGCSHQSNPLNGSTSSLATTSLTSANTVVGQDLGQLAAVGLGAAPSRGVFSIGWHQFIGPNIVHAGTIGQAFAVVLSDTTGVTRPDGIDIGAVSLTYPSGTTELTKRTTPMGGVMYSTFDRGMRHPETLPVNIPFVGGGVYEFTVTGSTAFSAGTFQITAPAELLKITSNANGDTIRTSTDLALSWIGGSATDSVLVRLVPHFRPEQIDSCDRRGFDDGPDSLDGPRGPGGLQPPFGPNHRGPGRPGHPGGPPPPGMPVGMRGPEFQRGIVLKVPNTGSLTITAAELQSLVGGTSAGELMVGVAQVVKQDVTHDGTTLTLLLRSGDSVVLRVR